MQKFKLFLRGYVQTMLYGIEQRPTYRMDQSFYFFLHLVNHLQFIAIIIQTNHDKPYQDFKLSYTKQFMEFFILNNILKSSMSYTLAIIIIVISFLSQIILCGFLSFSTFIRIWTSDLTKKDTNNNANSAIQIWVMSFNEQLHWLFVIYPVVYLQIAVISLSSIQCNSISLIPLQECEITPSIQFLSIVPLVISYIHGQILIYVMRNHRFHETNSLKRRYSSILLLNNSLILIEIMAHYIYEIPNSDFLKYITACIFAFLQIIDQLTNFPYRDPIRVPSIRMAFVYFWIVFILTIYRFIQFDEYNLFFLIALPIPLFCMIGEGLSNQFQHYAILNYNSDTQIEEKHIIVAVDQFYKFHLEFLKTAEAQIQYLQFLMIHRLYCKNRKCHSRVKKFNSLDLDQKKDLNTLTLSIIKCIFKAAQQWLFSIHNQNADLQFEQLQLQYISFVSEIASRPLVGYLELRQYQNNKLNNNSMYFIEITNKLADQLQKLILDNQERKNANILQIHEQRTQVVEISLEQQWQTQNLYENLLQTYLTLLDDKIEHWQNLMNGYPNLNPFQQSTQILCEKINNLGIELNKFIGVPEEWFDLKSTSSKGLAVKKMTHSQLNVNVITLKLYSLFYSLMMNDFDRTVYIEQYIKDLTSNDRQKEIDLIDNIALYNDYTTIILVSIVKKKGKIINKNQLALANFFYYLDANDFKDSIETVHNLLPKPMFKSHELLIDKFIQTGHSQFFIRKISGYYENKQGYLEKSYIKLGNLFEDKDDYVMTASILKCNILNQVIQVDMEGKIIGMSKNISKIIQNRVENADIQFMKEFCNFFLIFPQFIWIAKQTLQNKTEQLDFMIDDEEFLFYIPLNLVELNSQFVQEQYERLGHKLQQSLDSQNLSSWRSWKSQVNKINAKKDDNENPFSILDQENMNFHYEFLKNHKQSIQDYFIIKSKIKMTYQQFKIKDYQYQYFTVELDHLTEIDNKHKNFQKYQTFEQVLEKSVTLMSSQFHNRAQSESFAESNEPFKSTKNHSFEVKSKHNASIKVATKSDRNIDHERIKYLIAQEDNNILGNDYSEARLIEKQQLDLSEIIPIQQKQQGVFQQPVQKNLDDYEENELFLLDQQFDQIQKQSSSQNDNNIQQQQQQQQINEEEKDSSQQDIEDHLEKRSSNQEKQQRNDLLELLVKTRKMREIHGEHDEEENAKAKRSVASTSKTSTSKSPCLLVRSLYSLGAFQGGIKQIVIAIILFLSLQFSLVFIKMSVIQRNYDILQTNINFVTFPETLNFYFLKSGFLSWIGLEQQLNITQYSEFINKQIEGELEQMRAEIDVKLNELYQGIIQYEAQILDDELKLVSINDLNIFEQNLDLTQLIEQIQLHAFSFINNQQNASSIIVSDSLFFRLNLQYVYQFTQKYIVLLNNNLIYYEDKIINDILILTMTFLAIYTVITIYLIYSSANLTQYERQILMLITRVSNKTAEEIISVLYQAKSVLIEPSQLLWKRIDYFDLTYQGNYENQTNNQLISKSCKGSSLAKTVDPQNSQKQSNKSKRSYSSNSLAQRIYELTLFNPHNYISLFIIWFLSILFIIGAILVTITQISDIKPTLNLNLQLIKFKVRYDSLVVYGEILKSQHLVDENLLNSFQDYKIDMKIDQILNLFQKQSDGFQDAMNDIYNTLSGSSGLQQNQKTELLNYFEVSLCTYMKAEIPFCQVEIKNQQFVIPDTFAIEFGQPIPQDNNYEYLTGGIINAVSEFTKTLQIYFYQELYQSQINNDSQEILNFLNSTVHINQFTEYYLDTGKVLTLIGYNLFEQNQSKLNQATTVMQLYIYIAGIGVILLLIIISYQWLKKVSKRLQMMRLSLTLIPYEILIEPKTMSSLKQL